MLELLGLQNETARVNNIVCAGARMTDIRFIELEIQRFKASQRRKTMIDGERYFAGQHNILARRRMAIGKNGELKEITNLPNNKIVDNQYRKMVNQKVNYLLGKPISFKTDNATYSKALNKIFNKAFQRLLKNLGRDSLNCAVGWLFPHYNQGGEFSFKRFKPYEVIPGWRDAEHTALDYAIRIYEVISYEGHTEQVIEKVEVFDTLGVYKFTLESGRLVPDQVAFEPYFTVVDLEGGAAAEKGFHWLKIPLIPFKLNSEEIPIIRNVKALQDGLNLILSNFQNNMEEDARNTILVVVNYDGENLGELRQNLATYGAVKIKTVDGAAGDVRALQVEVNADNYKSILEVFKKAIVENAMGYDAKDDRMAGNPNQMNIQSMYSDIDLDANEMETEYQASFEQLMWFVNVHLFNTGVGDFEDEAVEVIFNRDILISESEVIDNCQKSVGILSDETIVANHPWVNDPSREHERLARQKDVVMEYASTFPKRENSGGIDEE